MNIVLKENLKKYALKIRQHVARTIIENGEGHMGSSMSCADIMAVLYGDIIDITPDNFESCNRDVFILSAGHKCLALYACLVESGFIGREVLDTYNQLNSPLPGHPDMYKINGVEISTGSLGHGLSIGCGMALAAKKRGIPNTVYVLMGDGEHGEGSVWEAIAFASHNKLDNLVAIVDKNDFQINGSTQDILYPAEFADRYKGFGWSVKEIDGHNIEQIYNTFKDAPFESGKPSVMIAKTTKGKGLSFAEDKKEYHHWHPDKNEASIAIEELDLKGVNTNG